MGGGFVFQGRCIKFTRVQSHWPNTMWVLIKFKRLLGKLRHFEYRVQMSLFRHVQTRRIGKFTPVWIHCAPQSCTSELKLSNFNSCRSLSCWFFCMCFYYNSFFKVFLVQINTVPSCECIMKGFVKERKCKWLFFNISSKVVHFPVNR